jgi:uncharacterized protein (DUF433 family)
MLQNGIPEARERLKIADEIPALGEKDSVTFVYKMDISRRISYYRGDDTVIIKFKTHRITELKFMFDRITFDPKIMGGRACIRGMRITVSLVLSLVANGMNIEEILEAYPYLQAEDIKACLEYAVYLANEEVRPIVGSTLT